MLSELAFSIHVICTNNAIPTAVIFTQLRSSQMLHSRSLCNPQD